MNTKQMAKRLAQMGRYGDSRLVHMNEAEVQILHGLAGLGNTTLTTNPKTGQLEAFELWQALVPLALGLLIPGAGAALGLGAEAAAGTTAAAAGATEAATAATLAPEALAATAAPTALTGGLEAAGAAGAANLGTAAAAAPSGLSGIGEMAGGALDWATQAKNLPYVVGGLSLINNALTPGYQGESYSAKRHPEQFPGRTRASAYRNPPAGYRPGIDGEWNHFPGYAPGGPVMMPPQGPQGAYGYSSMDPFSMMAGGRGGAMSAIGSRKGGLQPGGGGMGPPMRPGPVASAQPFDLSSYIPKNIDWTQAGRSPQIPRMMPQGPRMPAGPMGPPGLQGPPVATPYAEGGAVGGDQGQQLVQAAVAALTGQIQDPQQAQMILQKFAQVFGPEALQALVAKVKGGGGAPMGPPMGAPPGDPSMSGPPPMGPPGLMARGGHVRGPGAGMDDSIPATVNGTQPAALSDGEFVVPSDAVSHLGDGSNQAGADRLQHMIQRIRKDKTGTVKQPGKISPKVMPK